MQPLDTLPGHLTLKHRLKILAQNPPSTLLFEGPRGVGKSQFARAFAHTLLSSCNAHKLASGHHPDLREYFPEGKTSMHPMHAMKELIAEAEKPPFEATHKVFIIHEAERMLPSSSNALLKTLEEPFQHIIFILVTSHPELLLPTIVSRTFRLSFFPLPEDELASYIETKWEKKQDEARQMARLSQGSLTKADQFAQKKELSHLTLAFQIGTNAVLQNYRVLFRLLGEVENLEASLEELLLALYSYYRDLYLLKSNGDPGLLFFAAQETELRKVLDYPLPSLEAIQKRMHQIQEALACNLNPRHALLHLLL